MSESNRTLDATWVYGILLLLAACLLSYLLDSLGASTSCFLPVMLAGIALVTRRAILLFVLPLVVFTVLTTTIVFDRPQLTKIDESMLALVTLSVLALSSRLHCLLDSKLRRVITQRVTYAPTLIDESRRICASHSISLVFVTVAWFVAVFLTSDFAAATANADEFEAYRRLLRGSIRLDPWVYSGIRIAIILGTLFAVIHGLLAYLRCRSNDGMMAAMLLRHELWRWNGSEQRMIAKALRNK